MKVFVGNFAITLISTITASDIYCEGNMFLFGLVAGSLAFWVAGLSHIGNQWRQECLYQRHDGEFREPTVNT